MSFGSSSIWSSLDKFQSAYRCGHSTETALLRVYNDIVTMVGKGNGSDLVLLDLSAAFDTIDHDTLFVILEKYVGITGSDSFLNHIFQTDHSECLLMMSCRELTTLWVEYRRVLF